MNKWLDIYISPERNDLIKEIQGKTDMLLSQNLFLHGNSGQGKTHILIDLVARLRFRYLSVNFTEKPEKLIFYYLFSNKTNISETLLCFAEELFFTCFPLLKFEQSQQIIENENQKLTYLEELCKNMIKALVMDEEGTLFWPKVREIIDYITKENTIPLFIVFDQINEIPKLNKKENTVNQHFESINNFFQRQSLISILKCDSNNNQLMRQ